MKPVFGIGRRHEPKEIRVLHDQLVESGIQTRKGVDRNHTRRKSRVGLRFVSIIVEIDFRGGSLLVSAAVAKNPRKAVANLQII